RQVSLKLKASEPSLRRAVVSLSKPGRAFGRGAVLEPVVEGHGEHQRELEPVVETFEAVGPVVEQGALPTEAVAEPVAQPEWFTPEPEPELPAVDIPQPIVTQAEEITVPEIEPVFFEAATIAEPEIEPVFPEAATIAEPEIEPVFAEAATIAEPEIEPVFAEAEGIIEPEIEPVGQGQPIPQLTPVEEPSIVEVTEPEPAGFDTLRRPSELSFAPEPVFESRIYEPTTPVNMPEPIQI